jgi:hypothetical protein
MATLEKQPGPSFFWLQIMSLRSEPLMRRRTERKSFCSSDGQLAAQAGLAVDEAAGNDVAVLQIVL